MTDRYVRSADGNDGDSGATWPLAKATLAGVAAIDTAGDRIFLSQAHAEAAATAQTITLAGTISNPVQVLCGIDAAEPPTSLAATATVSTTGASDINISGHARFYGITFAAGDGNNAAIFRIGNGDRDRQIYEACSFRLGGSNSGNRIYAVNASGSIISSVKWKDCTVKFAHTSQAISVNGGFFEWDGGSIVAGGTDVTSLFTSATASAAVAVIRNVDLSGLAAAANLCLIANGLDITFINCKLPASPSPWSGLLATGTRLATFRAAMYNCDSADTNYRIWISDFAGDLIQETTIVRSGGASDGTTPLSWKLTSTANCNFLSGRFCTPAIVRWNDTVGSPLTATVEIVHDSTTALNDDEVWLEVQQLGTSGFPLGSTISDSKSDVLASAAAQSSSAVTWTTSGLSNPNKQKLSVMFTPQEKGYIHARVCMGAASYTIYADPLVTLA
jgi:hypothetical protein